MFKFELVTEMVIYWKKLFVANVFFPMNLNEFFDGSC